jgi:transmembrane sensor
MPPSPSNYPRTGKYHMTSHRHHGIPDHITKQAAEWFARSRADDFSAPDQDRLDAWLEADPAHRTAFDETLAAWDEAGRLVMPSLPGVKTSLPKVRSFFPWPRLRLAGLGLVACLIVCVVALKSELISYRNLNLGKQNTYRTDAGVVRVITLPDGSRLEMNGNSTVDVRFNPWQRNVTLAEGELFLEVQPDPDRPLEVRSHNGVIRVLGTRFNVRSRGGRVSVDVERGRVRIDVAPHNNAGAPAENRIITGGEGIDYSRAGGMDPVRLAKLDEISAWRDGKIVFHSMRLIEVLHELNHRYDMPVELGISKIGERRFTGAFDVSDPDEILEVIKLTFSLESEITRGGTILLWPKH